MTTIRPACVAGIFYPEDREHLRSEIRRLLNQVRTSPAATFPKALLVPHAGYPYSGAVAAHAFALLAPVRERIRRVVLLGPAHHVAIRGLALPDCDAFATPLGCVPLDKEAPTVLAGLPQVILDSESHAHEHALEVQLPLLQFQLERFTLVPLAVGEASATEVAEVLECLWGGQETLIVISSDLSHYHPYPMASEMDRMTTRHILALDPDIRSMQACGATPINGLLLAARRHGLRPHLLAQCNSGDTGSDRQQVVGYAAFAFTGEQGNVQ